jgi:hypothetical protein
MHASLSDRFREVLPHMSEGDREIMRSMQEKAKAYGGRLTDRQFAFAEIILARSTPKAPAAKIELSRIAEMFDRAAQSLNNPRVEFLCEDATEFTITRAKATSANPGFLYLKSDGTYMGKISPVGEYMPSREATASVTNALTAFAADPAAAALAYGKATGNCCFCRRGLTDARSVEAGYGPICADHYGLPWGE